MKIIRIIPNLLIENNFLVKGESFNNHKYVGDIYNAVKIFSEKKAHEIILLDISAREKKQIFDINLIKKIKNEIFIPLTVGGGIDNLNQASEIIDQGVEKISLNSILNENPKVVEEIAKKFGSQSVVASIDVKKIDNVYKVFFNNGKKVSKILLKDHIKLLENLGVGEIILTSIDYEGKRCGFDINLYKSIQDLTNLPIVANGGAANTSSFTDLFDKTNLSAATAGSLFVFFGNRKAVLLNYPNDQTIKKIMADYENI